MGSIQEKEREWQSKLYASSVKQQEGEAALQQSYFLG
jgi:hypothetical protein